MSESIGLQKIGDVIVREEIAVQLSYPYTADK